MGKLFITHTKFDPFPGKYSYHHWNKEFENDPIGSRKVLNNLVMGNFYYFMNVLLDMQQVSGEKLWISKRTKR